MNVGTQWIDVRVSRALQLDPSLASPLNAIRALLHELVAAEAAPLGDLVQGQGTLGIRLENEMRPGIYAISSSDASPGEFLHAGKATDRQRPILERLKDHLRGWPNGGDPIYGGRLFADLGRDPARHRIDRETTLQWLRAECVARWICPDRSPVEIVEIEPLVLGILHPRYPLNGANGERRGGKPYASRQVCKSGCGPHHRRASEQLACSTAAR
jgi:hypothetical protein